MKRRKNLYFGLGPAPTPSKRERAKSKREFQSGVERKRKIFKSTREKESATLFRQLQRDAKPQHARRRKIKPEDREAFYQMLRENPHLTADEIRKLRQTLMAKKRKKRKKNSRKGKMPAGLRKYWAAKRAKKNPAKKKRKRARRRKLNPKPRRRIRRRRTVKRVRVRNRRRPARKVRKRRVRRSNPRKGVARIKAPAGLGPKGLRQYAAMVRKAYPHATVRVVKK